ncbi:MAG: integrase [Magnetococcales bacterium]|nr:integrase [Magnetococcales bacterium]
MTTMISEVYEAFRTAGVPDDQAHAAAEARSAESIATKGDVSNLERKLDALGGEVRLIKWLLALMVAAEVLPMLKIWFGH